MRGDYVAKGVEKIFSRRRLSSAVSPCRRVAVSRSMDSSRMRAHLTFRRGACARACVRESGARYHAATTAHKPRPPGYPLDLRPHRARPHDRGQLARGPRARPSRARCRTIVINPFTAKEETPSAFCYFTFRRGFYPSRDSSRD
jgi:hypothetical protein